MSYRRIILILAGAAFLSACSGGNGDQAEPAAEAPASGAETEVLAAAEAVDETVDADGTPRVFIISPENGATVSGPVVVAFGIEGYSIAPAGTYEEGTGHHHLLIDAELPTMDAAIPANDNYVHFGKGQTEALIELEPGEHTLQLLLGDGNHIPHSTPIVSDPIVITVTVE